MINELFNAAIWEKAWKEDPTAMGNKMKKMGMDTTQFDHKAVAFNKEVFSEGGRQRSERIIGWLEGQGVDFKGISVLDVGAASGGFTVPFAERGARVTAVEPNIPLGDLFLENTKQFNQEQVELVREPFEHIDIAARGWTNAFDLVFVSMCPVVVDWASVERVLSTARKFCYISGIAGRMEHGLVNELLPLLTGRELHAASSDMAYLNHLLYLKGYSFESLITQEMKSAEFTIEAAIDEAMQGLMPHDVTSDETSRKIVSDYLHSTYPDNKVVIRQGGRFGKVMIRLQEQNMYSRAAAVKGAI
ncbi:class I SAM-dependent methyltransferase [Paenibacillus monticola]|uniref:SAM-dependent methyltransferase n=1 Tax=Paenibacillus monticola TaxID=2666075 RepID=A0A7X2HC01_9BACL|nr:class I SAM-dependent methyltransferase [Paenibacillus monticola]MRN57296.1 SAM-dependent methyltransferase [Paenibacillus monticola]